MSNTVQHQVLRLEREQVSAINRGDLRGAIQMFDRAFVGFSSTKHTRIQGLSALAKTFEYYLAGAPPRMTYRIQQMQVQMSGGVAVATFYWTVGLGRERPIRGRGTHVFARKGKNWRVIHEHFSRAH